MQAVEISHYAPIANILQIAAWWKINDNNIPWEDRRIRPGDVTTAGMSTSRLDSGILKSNAFTVLPFYRECQLHEVFSGH
jgi:hypothetical protein